MIKFIIAARRKREDTQERYFYEWGIIHVALMVTTPSVVGRTFKRYVQHYSISGIGDDMLVHPLSPMGWDNMADHWLDSIDSMLDSTHAEDYIQRMQPHVFGDKEFVLMLAEGTVVHQDEGFEAGGVKLIHFLKRKPGMSIDAFNRHWKERHAPAVLAATGGGLVRKYVLNTQHDFDRGFFAGSIFAHGSVNAYDGVEEFWFDSLDDLAQMRRDPRIHEAIRASEADFVDAGGTFSMVTTERVIYDYTLGDKSSPPAAIHDPDSLEAAIFRQGLRGWNIPPQTLAKDTP